MLTVSEAAARLGVTPRRIQQMIARGQLAATRHGRLLLITEQALTRVAVRPKVGRPRKPSHDSPPPPRQ